jgi:hypothetical protein
MASILHRMSIDAPPRVVQRLVAEKEGPAAWWTGRAVEGDDAVGGELRFFYGETEFMGDCSTNWGAWLTSLKAGAEGRAFGAYPAGEISRWD